MSKLEHWLAWLPIPIMLVALCATLNYILVALLFLAVYFFRLSLYSSSFYSLLFYLIGLSSVTLGRYEPSIIALLILLAFIIRGKVSYFGASYNLLIVGSIVSTLAFHLNLFDDFSLKSVLFLIQLLQNRSNSLFPTFLIYLATLSFFLLFSILSEDEKQRNLVTKGVFHGLILTTPLTLVQIIFTELNLEVGYLSNLIKDSSPFWSSMGRFRGFFQDPNAYGVSSAILFFLLLAAIVQIKGYKKWAAYFLFTIWLSLAFFSGSRLLLLSVAIFIGLLFGYYALIFKPYSKLRFWILVCCSVLGFVCLTSSLIYLPESIGRVVGAFDLSRLSETFYSRLIFWRVALAIWCDNLLLGVGFGNFQNFFTSYVIPQGGDLGLWIDNSNSFYLGILSETGVFGAFAFGIEILRLKLKPNGKNLIYLAGVVSLSVLLLFGPHFHFIEFSCVSALLLSKVFNYRKNPPPFVPVVLLMLPLYLQSNHKSGWYPWEGDLEGKYVRWTTRRASSTLNCLNSSSVELEVRSFIKTSLRVERDLDFFEISLDPTIWKRIVLDCQGRQQVNLGLVTSETFIPALIGLGADWRILGVQIRTNPVHFTDYNPSPVFRTLVKREVG